jgi:Geranylgeranyl pyrophosphate synthase
VKSEEIHPAIEIQTIRDLVKDDMAAMDCLIQERLNSKVPLIDQMGHYIVNSGGKRLRPVLLLLIAKHFRYTGEQHINLAAIIELIHTATLLHDDVVDASMLRRGKVSANQRWGNEASVLVGDFLYSRAFQMMMDADSMRVMKILSNTTNIIAEGEVQQLLNRHDPETNEDRYLEVIRNKTAKLFEAAGQLAAIICRRPRKEELALANFGSQLGMAFQLIDDALDYSATSPEFGKNIGNDLAEGKPTLPLLYAMWHGNPAQSGLIKRAIVRGGLDNIGNIRQAIERTGAIAYTARLAEEAANKAIGSLRILRQSSVYLAALQDLARFAVERKY